MKSLMKTKELFVLFWAMPLSALAQNYSTLLDSPLSGTEGGFSSYLNTVYTILIGLAALLAVLKVIVAGVKYMLSDVVTSKETAKKEIKTALLGLVIIISAVMILSFINPKLTQFDWNFEKINPTGSRNSYVGPATGPSQDASGKSKSPAPGVQSVSTHGDINENYISQEGNLVTYDVGRMCEDRANDPNNTKPNTQKLTDLENCKDESYDEGADALSDYCLHNGGNFGSIGNDRYTCLLPTVAIGTNWFADHFEAWKQSLLEQAQTTEEHLALEQLSFYNCTGQFNKDCTHIVYTDVLTSMCRDLKGGEIRDLDRNSWASGSNTDVWCVRFD